MLVALLCAATPVAAQLPTYPYPSFTPGAVIASTEVNSNFSLAADNALKRNGGGIIEGHITLNAGITIDSVDISAFLLATGHVQANTVGLVGTPAFAPTTDTSTGLYFSAGAINLALSGAQQGILNASGLTVRGLNIFNSSGKIPAITSTYFADLTAQGLQPAETSFTDGTALARLAADEAITGTYTFSPGSSASVPLNLNATWNNGAITFTGADVSITSTASAAASSLWTVKLAGTPKINTDRTGKTIIVAPKITGGASNGFFLVGDASGTGFWTPSASAVPVPSGLLAFFEAACPVGWTIKSDVGNTYNAQFVRGGATFATALGADTHTHSIDPPATTSTTESAGHTHAVNPPSASTTTNGAHTHLLSGTTGTSGGSHTHTMIVDNNSGSTVVTSTVATTNVGRDPHTHNATTDATNIDHTHSSGSYTADSANDHPHSVDYPSTTSGGVSTTHTHSLDIAAFTSASGSSVPAYVQVIVCRKD